jgi:membrane-associated protease RseP (regulator of RpoE activity)
VETVHQIADQLIQAGKVRRGFLGISPRDLSTPERQKHGIVGGALVEEVDEGSPAQKAGLTKDDIIVAVDKVQVSNRASLHAQIRDHKPGDLIVVEYIRNGKRQTVKAILDEAKDESFMGGLALKPGFPNSKAFNKIEFFDREELRLQLSELKKQVQRLQSEIDQLKERPRGD